MGIRQTKVELKEKVKNYIELSKWAFGGDGDEY